MKIICIGRNYTEHIEELKNEKPTEPVIFLKPDTSILLKKQPFFLFQTSVMMFIMK
jgi:2-keto-4-pentenoate hydratase/2-oxohepta-3-ene-1,7-dioic acid hydratase in catechol pathway